MPEEIQWITINGAPVPLNAQGEPLNEVGEKILGEAAKKREKASTASNQEKEPKAEGAAGQREARKTAEGNRETKAETGRTITKSDGIAYSKTYGEYLEECDGNAEKAAREFFQRQLFGKSVVRDIEGENLEVFFTTRSWRKLSHNMRDDPIKAEIVPHLPEIIFSGAYTENPLHKERSDGIIAFYEFRQIVHTSAGDLDVFVDVAEHPAAEQSPYAYNLTRQGRRNYENRLEYETKKRLPHLRPDSDGETSSDRSIVATDIIPTSFELVNIRFAGEPFEFEEDEMPRDRPNGDRLVFDVKTSKRHKDSNGYLHVEGSNITKEQIAPYYGREIPGWEGLGLAPHKLYYMYRPAEELEKAAGDFKGMPLLFEHHDTDASNPAKEFLIGSLGTDAEFKAPYVVSSLVITDGEAVIYPFTFDTS